MPAILLYAAASLLYAILAFYFWRTHWRGASAPRLARLERVATLAPFALHTWLVYDMLWARPELHFGFGQALSVMLWLAVLIYWIESRFLELEGMQAPILALAAVCAPLPALFPGLAGAPYTHSTEFRLHLALAMVAYGLFTIAALHALLMTLMERRPHGGALVGRYLYGWRGRVALRWTLVGFVALLLAYVGSRFVLEVILRRGLV